MYRKRAGHQEGESERGPSQQREQQLAAEPDRAAGVPGAPGMLQDARLAHPANAGRQAGLLQALQQQCGNAHLQRALAEQQPRHTGGTRPIRPAQHGGSFFRVSTQGDSLRMSFGMQAILDGEPGSALEEEAEQPLEGTLEPIRFLVGSPGDAISGTINLNQSTQGGGVDIGGGFGRCQPDVTPTFRVTPQPRALGLLGTDYQVSIQADIVYHWAVQSLGRQHIRSADDGRVSQSTWSQVAYDLTPGGGSTPRSPRIVYWCSDLSRRHELFHRDDFVGAFRRYKPTAEAWLNSQTASSTAGARSKSEQAMEMLVRQVTTYMGEGDFAPCEVRAYGDGRPHYQARADAVRARAQRESWPAGPVQRS